MEINLMHVLDRDSLSLFFFLNYRYSSNNPNLSNIYLPYEIRNLIYDLNTVDRNTRGEGVRFLEAKKHTGTISRAKFRIEGEDEKPKPKSTNVIYHRFEFQIELFEWITISIYSVEKNARDEKKRKEEKNGRSEVFLKSIRYYDSTNLKTRESR